MTNILILSILFLGGFLWADTNGVWHRAEDVNPGTFGGDVNDMDGTPFVFTHVVKMDNEVIIDKAKDCSKTYTDINGYIQC